MKQIQHLISAMVLFSIITIGLMTAKIIEQEQELQKTKASLEVAIEHISNTVIQGTK